MGLFNEMMQSESALRIKLERMAVALDSILVGGNHLALIIGADHPPYTAFRCADQRCPPFSDRLTLSKAAHANAKP